MRFVVGGVVVLAACIGHGAMIERPNAAVAGTKFKVIATIAAGGNRSELRMSVTVRKQLTDAGWQGVARAGRWETQGEATTDICQPGDVDGVLYVAYNRLELMDCATHASAYEIEDNKGLGVDEMVRRLMRYLRGGDAPSAGTP